MFKLALRNIFRQKTRTAMTMSAVAFGVVGLILSAGFLADIFVQLGEALIHSHSGHIQVSRIGYFTYGSRAPEKYLLDANDPVLRHLGDLPEVDELMARVNFSGLLNNGKTDWPIVGEGVEAGKEARLGSFMHIAEGRQLEDKDRFGVILGDGVARALKLKPGDRATLLLNTPEGALNDMEFEVVGVFQTFSKDFDARAVRIQLPAAKELLGTNSANALVISLKRTPDTENVARKIASQLEHSGYELKTWVQLNDFYDKAVALYAQQFGFLRLIILAMVVLSVANSVNMSVFERVGEFGTIMALGSRPAQVVRLVVTENFLLGLIGSALGVLVGVASASLISAIGIPMPPPPNADIGYTAHILIVPSAVVSAFLTGPGATVLASLWPAWRVSRTRLDEALAQNY
jgi:putative ABC transport system permease protein